MNDSTPNDDVDAGKAAMRGMIHTLGLSKAVTVAAEMYSAPANLVDRDMLAGMLTAAYEAGQLDALNAKYAVS